MRVQEFFGIFEYVNCASLPADTKLVPLVTIYTFKYSDIRKLTEYKARLSCPGNRPLPNSQYNPQQLSAYIAERDAIRLLIAMATIKRLDLRHMDLKSAFLHELYKETLLCLFPIPSFHVPSRHHGKIACIINNDYGLPQAPLVHLCTLHAYLRDMELT